MSFERVMPQTLSNLNGSIVDLNSKIGSKIEIQTISSKDEKTKANGLKSLPEIVIYEHIDFGGVNERTNLNYYYVGDFWNDKISSIIIVSGVWEFYEHHHYEGAKWRLGPGYYRWIVDAGIPNDIISSFQVIEFTN